MTNKEAAIIGAIAIVMAFVGGMWFLFHRQMTNPNNRIGVQVVEVPVEQVRIDGKALELKGETLTVEVMPDKSWASGLTSPLAFVLIMSVIIGTGGVMLWGVV